MKKLLFAGLMALLAFSGYSQQAADSVKTNIDSVKASVDRVIFKSGDEIDCKVTQITDRYITYKSPGSSVDYICEKNKVLMILYANGTKEIFKQDESLSSSPEEATAMFNRGMSDANMYYDGENSGAGATMATTIVFGLVVGLIPAIACASTPPSVKNFVNPDRNALKNPDYVNGYRKAAHRIKKKKVWGSYGRGILIELAVFAGLSLLSAH